MSRLVPAPLYQEILESVPIPCVDVVIEHKGKVLLLLRTNKPAKGEWWTPGGRIHKGEQLEEAAKRKVFEETGLQVTIERQLGAYSTLFTDGPFEALQTGVHSINVAFLAHPVGNGVVKVDSTSETYAWVDTITETFPDYTKQLLRDARVFN